MKQTSYHQDASAFDPSIIDSLINPIRPAIRDAVAKMVQEEITLAVQNAVAAVSPHAAQVDAFHRAITVRSASAPYTRRSAKSAGKKKCSMAGCGEPMRCKGLCSAHYQAARRMEAQASAKRTVKKPTKANKKPVKKPAKATAKKRSKKATTTKKAAKPVEVKPAEA